MGRTWNLSERELQELLARAEEAAKKKDLYELKRIKQILEENSDEDKIKELELVKRKWL